MMFPVAGTPFDFTEPRSFGSKLEQPHPQLEARFGYDRNAYLGEAGVWKEAAWIQAPVSGITMQVQTTQTGMQLYCPGYLLEGHPGKGHVSYKAYGAFCIET